MLSFKESEATKQAELVGGSFNNVFKVRFKEGHMEEYLNSGRIDKDTLNKLKANKIKH